MFSFQIQSRWVLSFTTSEFGEESTFRVALLSILNGECGAVGVNCKDVWQRAWADHSVRQEVEGSVAVPILQPYGFALPLPKLASFAASTYLYIGRSSTQSLQLSNSHSLIMD
jgi:hypothetical protein